MNFASFNWTYVRLLSYSDSYLLDYLEVPCGAIVRFQERRTFESRLAFGTCIVIVAGLGPGQLSLPLRHKEPQLTLFATGAYLPQ